MIAKAKTVLTGHQTHLFMLKLDSNFDQLDYRVIHCHGDDNCLAESSIPRWFLGAVMKRRCYIITRLKPLKEKSRKLLFLEYSLTVQFRLGCLLYGNRFIGTLSQSLTSVSEPSYIFSL